MNLPYTDSDASLSDIESNDGADRVFQNEKGEEEEDEENTPMNRNDGDS